MLIILLNVYSSYTVYHQFFCYQFLTLICCVVGGHVIALECDESPLIAHSVAVVGGAEDSYTLSIMSHLVTIIL